MKVGRPFFCGEFDERIKPAKSFYGSHAMAKTFLEMPRGSSANAKTFFFRFAELPQTPKHIPRDLRDSRKHQSISRGTCGSTRKRQGKRRETCGSTRKRQGKRRETCGSTRKRQSISRGTCGTSAGHFQKHFGRLQRTIKDILIGLGSPFFHRTHVVYEITYFLLAIACKMRLKCHRQSEMGFSGLIPYVCP